MVTASVPSIAFIPLAMDLMGRFVDRPLQWMPLLWRN